VGRADLRDEEEIARSFYESDSPVCCAVDGCYTIKYPEVQDGNSCLRVMIKADIAIHYLFILYNTTL